MVRFGRRSFAVQNLMQFSSVAHNVLRAWRSGFCALACVSESHFAKPVLWAVRYLTRDFKNGSKQNISR